ncbi:MAG TPA: hypothetical protein VFY92_03230 [Hyphomicrobiaceae bacterium]|nr:hypothetical protein [Hyphomicrobiaceae bacterium]
MAFLTADVVPDPGGELPYKVVFKQGETIIGEWPVETQAEGEQQIVDLIRDAIGDEREDDDEEDDEDDDEDEDDGDRPPRGTRVRDDD